MKLPSRTLIYATVGASLALAGGAGVWAFRDWPFTRQAITRTLETRFARQVTIGRFRETWFPPGCVGEDIQFLHRDRKDLPALVTVHRFVVKASWSGLARERIAGMEITGVRITVPASDPSQPSPIMPITDKTSHLSGVDEIDVTDADVEVLSGTKSVKPTTFYVRRLVLKDVAGGRPIVFRASLNSGTPVGAIEGSGTLGPWNATNASATPISGEYRYADADLAAFHGLSGKLSGKGQFAGTLARVETKGAVDVPEFHVDGSAHDAHLTADFQASVDTMTADTVLEKVEARIDRTIVTANGTVAGSGAGGGKTATLEMAVNTGRVEDLLNFFSSEKRASMTGAVTLRAHVELPPGEGFLKRVQLTGDFGVAGGKFTNALRQARIDHLSESASGEKKARQDEDPRTVLSNLTGHVVIRDGTATLSHLAFDFPGAATQMEGTYNLLAKTIDIHGTLRTTGTLSDSSSGFKAAILKVVTPFLKKNRVTVAPFVITGSASKPSIGLDWHL